MSSYQAPVREMQFVLYEVFSCHEWWQQNSTLAELVEIDTANAIIDESAKLCNTLIAPFGPEADRQGVRYHQGKVSTPDAYKENFATYAQGGWIGLTGDVNYGGMGLPKSLATLHDEMMCASDISFSLYPSLTTAAALTIYEHGSESSKQTYLEKLYSGEWTGTMCLTEPHAGTDLGIMRTTAKPQPDGSYKISGSKMFITAGEHDLTDNIIHLVLAKIEGAPAGSRGISLFIVPKIMVTTTGALGEENTLSCGSVEHKMGIHASATCVMNFDQATGFLLGEPHQGLAAMFTMMNYERLSMGSQGLGCADRAYQNALAYAKERKQGRQYTKDPAQAESILVHPDVRRMLLTMKSFNEAGRAFNVFVASHLDRGKFSDEPELAQKHQKIAELLTPITKAFVTDISLEVCILGQQTFGGHGYIQEWGMEQLVRDVRIAQIYEGTNGIQALDLIGRKVFANKGQTLGWLLADIEAFIAEIKADTQLGFLYSPLHLALSIIQEITGEILDRSQKNKDELGSAAVDYLHCLGLLFYGYMWGKISAVAVKKVDVDPHFYGSKIKTAKYFVSRILPRIHTHAAAVRSGSFLLYQHQEDEF